MSSTKEPAKRPSKPFNGNPDVVNNYEGYHPLSASALAEQTHRLNVIAYDEDVASTFQQRSFRPLVFCIVMMLVFLFIVVWQILIGNCQISLLCRYIDESSRFDTKYRFRTFDFKVPSFYVWLGITSGSAAMLVGSFQLLIQNSKPVHSKKISFVMALVKQSSAIILMYHYLILILPTTTLVFVFGFTMNWNVAGSFSLGVTVCMLGNQIATHLHVRTVSKLASGWLDRSTTLPQLLSFATYKAAIICIFIYALFSISTSAVYLMYIDLRAAVAFAGGGSLVLLLTRVSNTALFESTMSAFALKPPYRASLPPNVITVISSNIVASSGILADLFVSFTISAVTTALAGASMPYFSQNQFATCVFNHLYIDSICGPFGYPYALSHAFYICVRRNLYFEYPFLSESSSASMFVATPFVLVATSVLVYLLCWPLLCFRLGQNLDGENIDQDSLLCTFLSRYNRTVVLTSCMLIVASAAVFFGLFGLSSEFQSSKSFAGGNQFPKLVLDGSSTQCVLDMDGSNAVQIPKGAIMRKEPYRPLLVTGRSVGEAAETGRRLFGCSCIGIIFGTVVVLFYTQLNFQRQSNDGTSGVMSSIFRNVSISFVTQAPLLGLLAILLISSYELYGAYGVGIAVIGYVSVSTASTLLQMTGRVLTNIRNILVVTHLCDSEDAIPEIGIEISSTATTAGNVVNNCSAALVCVIAIFGTMLQSGLWPSPRDLVGTTSDPPLTLIASSDSTEISTILSVAGALLGAIGSVTIWAILNIGVDRTASGIYVARKALSFSDLQVWPKIVGRLLRLTMLENSAVLFLGLLWPSIVGFGLGAHSLVAMLTTATTTSFVTAGMLNHLGVTVVDGVPNDVGKIVREIRLGTSPAFHSLMKVWVTLGLVMSTAMDHDARRGWIGLIIFLVSGAILCLITWRNHVRYGKILEFGGIRDEPNKWEGPGVRVSPFFEDGNTVHLDWMGIGSELRERLKVRGIRRGRTGIDGITDSNNEERRSTGSQRTIFPRQRKHTVAGLTRDESRDKVQ